VGKDSFNLANLLQKLNDAKIIWLRLLQILFGGWKQVIQSMFKKIVLLKKYLVYSYETCKKEKDPRKSGVFLSKIND
jgi:hypothetical protein